MDVRQLFLTQRARTRAADNLNIWLSQTGSTVERRAQLTPAFQWWEWRV